MKKYEEKKRKEYKQENFESRKYNMKEKKN